MVRLNNYPEEQKPAKPIIPSARNHWRAVMMNGIQRVTMRSESFDITAKDIIKHAAKADLLSRISLNERAGWQLISLERAQ
jgi:hypothetical protein